MQLDQWVEQTLDHHGAQSEVSRGVVEVTAPALVEGSLSPCPSLDREWVI